MAYGQKASSCNPLILLEFMMIDRSSIEPDWQVIDARNGSIF